MITELIESGRVNVSTMDPRSNITALHYAAAFGHEAIVELLLQHEADVNSATWRGDTPLHAAAFNGSYAIARLLLNSGANSSATNRYLQTPLHVAVASGHQEFVESHTVGGR